MSSNFESEVEGLKHAFPDIYLDLQTAALEFELVNVLRLRTKFEREEANLAVKIALNDGYELLIRPAVPGYDGYDFWMSWRFLDSAKLGRSIRMSQLRCRVELVFNDQTEGDQVVASFGLDAPNMKELVARALAKIQAQEDINLVALPANNRKKAGNANE